MHRKLYLKANSHGKIIQKILCSFIETYCLTKENPYGWSLLSCWHTPHIHCIVLYCIVL